MLPRWMVTAKRLVGADHDPGLHLLPCGIGDAVDLNDAIARLQVGLGSGGVGSNPINHGRLVHKNRVFVVHHVNAGEQKDSQHNIHGGTGDGDEKTMPARVREKFRRIAGALIHGILAAHLDVAAQGNRADPIVGVSLAEAEQALAKADGENLDPDPQPFGNGIMAKFMNQDHESEDDDNGDQRNQKVRHD